MKFTEILKRIFLDRCCVICGEPISYDVKEPFCELCVKDWQEFLKIKCRKCGREQSACSCLPSKARKINHSMASWSVFYDTGANGEINKLFTYLKRRYDRGVIDLCTERMKNNLVAMCKNRGIDYKEFAVTYAPRSRKNVRKYGFDQSKKLAQSLAKKLDIKVVKTFKNIGKTEQKGLNKQERARNAIETYKFIDGSIKENMKLFIVDDVMTTGATLFSCSFHLYKNGATSVVPVVFAKDNYNSKGDKNNVKRNSKYHFTRAIKGFVRNGSQR